MYKFETAKDVKKLIRSILELAVLIWVLFVIARALFTFSVYEPYAKDDKEIVSGEDHGFIALSYFGIDREGSSSRISEDRLNKELKALRDNGYVTITQKDIEDYYKNGTPLPDKALYLMFEDGRQDTAIYAQKVMEEYNYKATMFTYAEKFDVVDSFFLMPKDLLKLEQNSFWEIGSNGYRLSYINVFDRYGRYIGELNSKEYSAMSKYLGRDYNHYLMDYIRDANDLPMETNSQMRSRISGDYELMKKSYNEGLGKVPSAYILLHSNTGMFGENDKVSEVNEEAIASTFIMNFNREGYSLNNTESSIYDLTRLEPQANWYTNHLLMRIRDDLPKEDKDGILFVVGDKSQNESWQLQRGAVEYQKGDERIVLTSLPEDTGSLKLLKKAPRDIAVETTLKGNKLGLQAVILGADDDGTGGVEVSLQNNVLCLYQDGQVLEEVDLYEFDGTEKISVDEDKRDSLAGEYAALARYAVSAEQSYEYTKMSKEASLMDVPTVKEGAEEYRPQLKLNEPGSRELYIELKDNVLNVKIDGKDVWKAKKVTVKEGSNIYLKGAFTEYGYSQRNVVDDVYDAVFDKLQITDPDTGNVLYSYRLTGIDKIIQTVKNVFNKVLNWFIKYI